jgi:hypothetical protein
MLSACAHVLCAPSWYSIGLDKCNINDLIVWDSTRMMAATDSGLYVFGIGRWYKIDSPTLPAMSLADLGNGTVMAACGNGTRSDGIYRGMDQLDGPPFYVFSLLDWAMFPTAVVAKGTDTIYAGTPVKMYRSVRHAPGNDWRNLVELGTPDWLFGVEMPRCADIHVFDDTGTVYAGGYDRSPMPGPGSIVYVEGDTCKPLVKHDVSAITSGNYFEVGPAELVFGTIDTGLFKYNPGTRVFTHIPSPNNEAVKDVISVTGGFWSDFLYVAVESGVYQGGAFGGTNWTPVGTLVQIKANCLVNAGWNDLYAGTTRGVYRYGEAAGIEKRNKPKARAKVSLANPSGTVLTLRIQETSEQAVFYLFNIKGQLNLKKKVKGGLSHISGLKPGIYIYKLVISGKCMDAGKVVLY